MHGRALVCNKHSLTVRIGLDACLVFQSALGLHSNPNDRTRNGRCDHTINNHPNHFLQVPENRFGNTTQHHSAAAMHFRKITLVAS